MGYVSGIKKIRAYDVTNSGRYISCCNQSIRGCVAPLPSVPARHVVETLFDLGSVIVTRSRWQADTMSHLAALPVHGTKEYGVMGVYRAACNPTLYDARRRHLGFN